MVVESSGVDIVGLIEAIGYWVFGFIGVAIGAAIGLQIVSAGIRWAKHIAGGK